MDTRDSIALQNAEFGALTELAKRWTTLQRVPVVDDDYPEHRHYYERALREFLRAVASNRGGTVVDARSPLTFQQVTDANVARCDRWHKGGLKDWSVADWAVAMAGEAGEVCNAVKKLRRVEDDIANISDEGRLLATREQAIAKIGEELADTFLYLNLLGVRLGINLSDQIIAKFNTTSERYGFPERLP